MSYRSNTVSKEFLLLNVAESSIHYPREKHIIDEYKQLFNEKEKLEKNLDILLYAKKNGLLTSIQTKLLRRKIDQLQGQLSSIENSSVLKALIDREQERRQKERQQKERALEEQKAKEAEQLFAANPFVAHDDDYYDRLWRTDYQEFWNQVKLEWRARNPGKTTNEAGFPFEKGCEYLKSQLVYAPKSLTIAEMRAKMPCNRKNPNPCIYDIISKYIYYHPMYK
jgi:hypothetical protein